MVSIVRFIVSVIEKVREIDTVEEEKCSHGVREKERVRGKERFFGELMVGFCLRGFQFKSLQNPCGVF